AQSQGPQAHPRTVSPLTVRHPALRSLSPVRESEERKRRCAPASRQRGGGAMGLNQHALSSPGPACAGPGHDSGCGNVSGCLTGESEDNHPRSGGLAERWLRVWLVPRLLSVVIRKQGGLFFSCIINQGTCGVHPSGETQE